MNDAESIQYWRPRHQVLVTIPDGACGVLGITPAHRLFICKLAGLLSKWIGDTDEALASFTLEEGEETITIDVVVDDKDSTDDLLFIDVRLVAPNKASLGGNLTRLAEEIGAPVSQVFLDSLANTVTLDLEGLPQQYSEDEDEDEDEEDEGEDALGLPKPTFQVWVTFHLGADDAKP